MRRILATALSLVVCLHALAQTAPSQDLPERAKKFKPGSTVVVKLRDRTKVVGKLAEVTDSGIRVVDRKDQAAAPRAIPYEQIRSLDKKTPVWAWVVVGGVGACVLLPIIVIAALGGWKS